MPNIIHYSLLYPLQFDLQELSEMSHPHYFDYFCLSGSQLFLVRERKHYVVVSAGWFPLGFQPLATAKFHKLFHSDSFDSAKRVFRSYVRDLLSSEADLFGTYLSGDL